MYGFRCYVLNPLARKEPITTNPTSFGGEIQSRPFISSESGGNLSIYYNSGWDEFDWLDLWAHSLDGGTVTVSACVGKDCDKDS